MDACVNARATAVSADAGSCAWLPSGKRCPAAGVVDDSDETLLAAAAAGVAGLGLAAAPVVGVVPIPVPALNVWLIWTSCSRLLTPTNCVMYCMGSVCVVGSWFWISVTSSVRKSLAVIVAWLGVPLVAPALPALEEAACAFAPVACACGFDSNGEATACFRGPKYSADS